MSKKESNRRETISDGKSNLMMSTTNTTNTTNTALHSFASTLSYKSLCIKVVTSLTSERTDVYLYYTSTSTNNLIRKRAWLLCKM